MVMVFAFGKNRYLYIKTEQYHREADFTKILPNIVDFRLNVRIHVSYSLADKHF